MRIRWTHLLIPLASGVVAFEIVPLTMWVGARTALMTTLSVIAAGVLVRLARGLPFTNADQFELDEARSIAAAVVASVRALRMLIFATLLTMGVLIVMDSVAAALKTLLTAQQKIADLVEPASSAIAAILLTYVLVRIVAVIGGDVGLVNLQTKFLVASVARKQGKKFEEAQAASQTEPFKNPHGYGKPLQ